MVVVTEKSIDIILRSAFLFSLSFYVCVWECVKNSQCINKVWWFSVCPDHFNRRTRTCSNGKRFIKIRHEQWGKKRCPCSLIIIVWQYLNGIFSTFPFTQTYTTHPDNNHQEQEPDIYNITFPREWRRNCFVP